MKMENEILEIYNKYYGETLQKINQYRERVALKPIYEFLIEWSPIGIQDDWYSDKAGCGKYRIKVNNHTIATWELYQMKNCCGICVSTVAIVTTAYQRIGLGTIFNKMRIDLAKSMGYGLLLCTDVSSNIPQQRILNKNKWEKIYEFNNPRTKNDVSIHVFKL